MDTQKQVEKTNQKCNSFMPTSEGEETAVLCALARGHQGEHVSRSGKYRWPNKDAEGPRST